MEAELEHVPKALLELLDVRGIEHLVFTQHLRVRDDFREPGVVELSARGIVTEPLPSTEMVAELGLAVRDLTPELARRLNYGIDEGVVVDTHVTRISNRLGLTAHKDAVKIERDLMDIVPRKEWTMFPHLMIWHGREICQARKPRCEMCPIGDLCPSTTQAS